MMVFLEPLHESDGVLKVLLKHVGKVEQEVFIDLDFKHSKLHSLLSHPQALDLGECVFGPLLVRSSYVDVEELD